MTLREKIAIVRVTLAIALAMLAAVCAFAAGLSRLRATVLAVALLVAWPALAHAEDHDRSRLGVASFAASMVNVGLSGADALITYKAVKAGQARESNPWLVPHVEAHGIGRTMAAKFAINVGTELGLRYVEKRWPEQKKAVLLARLASIGINGYAVAHNLRVLRGAR